MIEYDVACADGLGDMIDTVNRLLSDGWKLQGGIAVTALPGTDPDTSPEWFYQAMVREVPDAS